MYETVQHSSGGTRAVGVVATALLTAGFGYLFATGMTINHNRVEPSAMEMVILTRPEPPPPVEEIKKVETPIEVPPAAPELVAPDIQLEIEAPPVITAPVVEPMPIPDPIPAPPAPAVGTDRLAPKLVAGNKPQYPPASVRTSEQGTTRLEVCVNANGRVTSVSVAGTSGFQRLDDAAAKRIRNERFTPGSVGGVAQSMCGHTVAYQWNLQNTT